MNVATVVATKRVVFAQEHPIPFDAAAKACPAMVARTLGPTVMPSHYQHISTGALVKQFEELGYGIASVSSERGGGWQDEFAKHMVRLRPVKAFRPRESRRVGDYVPEIVLVNAHNGSSKLHLLAGLWRFLCANGMMAGETVAGFHFRHAGSSSKDIAEESASQMAKIIVPQMEAQVEAMQAKKLSRDQIQLYGEQARQLRWGDAATVRLEDVLQDRRAEDKGSTAWQVYNRVQENVLRGGFVQATRNAQVRPLESVTRVVQVNRDLWDMAVRLAA